MNGSGPNGPAQRSTALFVRQYVYPHAAVQPSLVACPLVGAHIYMPDVGGALLDVVQVLRA